MKAATLHLMCATGSKIVPIPVNVTRERTSPVLVPGSSALQTSHTRHIACGQCCRIHVTGRTLSSQESGTVLR